MITAQCQSCRRYRGNLACDAYPARIPATILKGQADHTEPQPGDGGLRYDPIYPSHEHIKKSDDTDAGSILVELGYAAADR